MSNNDVTGLCDSGCGKDATRWFGSTCVAICEDHECMAIQKDAFDQHCKDMDMDDDDYY